MRRETGPRPQAETQIGAGKCYRESLCKAMGVWRVFGGPIFERWGPPDRAIQLVISCAPVISFTRGNKGEEMDELMTGDEIHDFGIEVVCTQLQKEGHEIVSVQSKFEENPQIIATKDGRLKFITVRTACYPSKGKLESKQLAFELIAHADMHKATCYFASVGPS
jgi:hypothetical protein